MPKKVITITSPVSAACPDNECGETLANCNRCDGFLLIPINPALLIDGVHYLEGVIISGPETEGTTKLWMVEIEESYLTNPNASFSQCDYRICCNDCKARFVKVITDALAARIAALEN